MKPKLKPRRSRGEGGGVAWSVRPKIPCFFRKVVSRIAERQYSVYLIS